MNDSKFSYKRWSVVIVIPTVSILLLSYLSGVYIEEYREFAVRYGPAFVLLNGTAIVMTIFLFNFLIEIFIDKGKQEKRT